VASEVDEVSAARPSRGRLAHVPAKVSRALYILVPTAGVLLLLAHTLRLKAIAVDTTTLGLLALLLLVPLAPYVTRLKAAGIEAEIGPREAQQLQASAADLPAAAEQVEETSAVSAPTVSELIARDPPLGLARLRMDLERELNLLAEKRLPHEPRGRARPPGVTMRELQSRGVLPDEIGVPLRDVWTLTSRAIHGEYVPIDVAEDIANVGLRVLNALRLINETDEEAAR
jgi:hypothetical protein